MAGLFKRIFRVAQAEAHAAVDKLEDPVKMTEQGIRELKQNFAVSIKPCTSQSLCDSPQKRWRRPTADCARIRAQSDASPATPPKAK